MKKKTPQPNTPHQLEPVLEHILQSHHKNSIEHNRLSERALDMNIEGNAKIAEKIGEVAQAISEKKDDGVRKIKIEGIEVITLKGDKGNPGNDGKDADEQKIIDSVTEKIPKKEDIVADVTPSILEKVPKLSDIVAEVVPHIKNGEDGDDGNDADPEKVAEIIKSDQSFLEKIKGNKGEPGKDGSPDTAQEIVRKLSSLTDEERFSYLFLKETPTVFRNGMGYLKNLTDVQILTDPTNGQGLIWDSTLKVWKPGTVSSSGGSPLTTKGDIYTFSTVDARLPAGVNGQVLTADSTQATGLKWTTVSGTGDVVGPGGATANALAIYNSTTGKLIKNSAWIIDGTTGALNAGVGQGFLSSDLATINLWDSANGVTSPLAFSDSVLSWGLDMSIAGNFTVGTIQITSSAQFGSVANTINNSQVTNATLTLNGYNTFGGGAQSVIQIQNVTTGSPKLGFNAATPIAKPSGDVATALSNLGLITSPTIIATTNANLTGVITSVGNATSIALQTGTGTKFVVDTSPTLVTPNIGVARATTIGIGATADTLLTVSQQTTMQAPVSGSTAHFVGLDANPLRINFDTHNTGSAGTALFGRRSRGTAGSPSALALADTIYSLNALGYGTTGYAAASTGLISFKAAEAFTDTAMGTDFVITTTPVLSVTAAEVARFTGTQLNLGVTGTMLGKLFFSGNTSTGITLQGQAVGSSGVLTLPAVTDTLAAIAATQTLTNKRVTRRVVTAADATSITPNTDNADETRQTNTQSVGTLTINADAGTPTDGQGWVLVIKSTNIQTFSWNAIFVGGTVALPTATTGSSKMDMYSFKYSTINSKWNFIGNALGF